MTATNPAARRGAIAIAAVLVGGLGAYLFSQTEHIARSYALDPGSILAIAGLAALILGLRSVQNRLVFERLDVHATPVDWFGLVSVASLTNYLPFSAGLIAKALYLKRVHATSYATFALGQAAILLLVLTANGVAGLVVLAKTGGGQAVPLVLGFSVMLASGALLWLPGGALQKLDTPAVRRRLPDGLGSLRNVRSAWPGAVATQFAILACSAATLRLAFGMGGVEVAPEVCVILGAVSVLTSLVSLTPGALGLRELLLAIVGVATGVEVRDTVIASTLARVGEMIAIFGIGGIFTYTMSRRALDGGGSAGPDDTQD